MMLIALDKAMAPRVKPDLRSLYVSRGVKNADDIITWAKAQGFSKPLAADDLHVTIAYSKTKVDWFAAPDHFDDIRIPAAVDQKDGERSVEALGDKGAVVLRFESPDLESRWQAFRDAGASWDFEGYKPHITITYEPGDVDLTKVEPYAGMLELGPERFEEIDEDSAPAVASDAALAFDRNTVRSFDRDGRLHVATTNISKAAINPYLGREIPDFEALGLNPDKTYRLFRDPEELAKAASTFNNLPLLSRHVPVSADDHQPDLVVGSTGSEAEFDAPYLRNSLVIWARHAIAGVEDRSKQELSSAYRYRADMTPGTYEGAAYDGVMRDIVGNHVSLVTEGRAGPDVVVGDSMEIVNMSLDTITLASDEAQHDPGNGQFTGSGGGGGGGAAAEKSKVSRAALKEKLEGMSHEKLTAALSNKNVEPEVKKYIEKELDSRADRGTSKGHREARDQAIPRFAADAMKGHATMKTVLTRKAIFAQGALLAAIGPKLAQDAKIDLTPVFAGITAKNFKAKSADILAGIKGATKGKLAQDASIEDVAALLDTLDGIDIVEGADIDPSSGLPAPAMKPDDLSKDSGVEAIKAFLAGKLSDEDIAKVCAMIDAPAAMDADDDDKDEGIKDMIKKPAMDAAIAAAVKAAEDRSAKRQVAIRDAERAVRPYVGDLAMAHDSADAVYITALTSLGIPVEGIHPSALPAILAAQPLPGAKTAVVNRVAMDSAATKSFHERFPGTAAIGRA